MMQWHYLQEQFRRGNAPLAFYDAVARRLAAGEEARR